MIRSTQNRTLLSVIWSNTVTPFNGLNTVVITGLAIVFVLNDRDTRFLLDAVGVVLATLLNTFIAIMQEVRAHRAVERATASLTHDVVVVRDAVPCTLDRSDVAVGDVVVLSRGSVMPADGTVQTADALEIDTSMLTGEALPIRCAVGTVLLAGSACVAGCGTVRITRVGDATQAARIGHAASRLMLETSPMQRHINRLFEASFAVAVLIAVTDVLMRVQRHAIDADAIRHTAAIVLGLIPEGLMLFTTVTFALCMARMARLGVHVQHLSAVESLASVDAMCFDKTGTLTERRTRVADVTPLHGTSHHEAYGILSAYAHAIKDEGLVIDALRRLPRADNITVDAIQHVPFTSEQRYSAIQTAADCWYVLGAPEVLLPQAWAEGAHASGRQVALCTASSLDPELSDVRPLCLVTLDDTTSPHAAAILAGLDTHGVALHVLTGDAEASAHRVLREAGRIDEHGRMASNTVVQARMLPQEKQAYVASLRAQGHHVAMIGDGVNDVPALREANVGVAVRGAADVARHVADIVMDKADLDVLPTVMLEGRVAMRTIMHIANIFLAKNAALLAIGLVTACTSLPLLLTPRRGGLLSVLAVAIPSAVLAARSRSVTPVTRPYTAILRYAVLMSLAACSACLLTAFAMSAYGVTAPFALYVTMLASVLASLPYVDNDATVRRLLTRLSVASMMAFVAVLVGPNVPPVTWIRLYFELPMLALADLTPVVTAVLVATSITVILHGAGQRWRGRHI